MSGGELAREVVAGALTRLGLEWSAWPDAAADPRLDAEERLAALLLLLEGTVDDEPPRDGDAELYSPRDLDALPPMPDARRAWIMRDRTT